MQSYEKFPCYVSVNEINIRLLRNQSDYRSYLSSKPGLISISYVLFYIFKQ